MSDDEPAAALAEVRDMTLSVDEVLAAVRHRGAGAVALFVGTVRDHDEGRGVTGLDYSAHPSASSTMAAVAAAVAAAHPDTTVAVTHRTGELEVGDVAIVAAASSAHRAAAFEAVRALVEAVKADVPIWKRQEFDDGGHDWVGAT